MTAIRETTSFVREINALGDRVPSACVDSLMEHLRLLPLIRQVFVFQTLRLGKKPRLVTMMLNRHPVLFRSIMDQLSKAVLDESSVVGNFVKNRKADPPKYRFFVKRS